METAVQTEIEQHYTQTEIKNFRGWTGKMLELLPQPDRMRTYWTRGRRGGWHEHETGEWSDVTLARIEETAEFQSLWAAVEKRREKAAATKAEKQNRFAAMEPDALANLALACLHAANRRVKHYDRGTPLSRRIYAAKDTALLALLRAGRAALETFIDHGYEEWHMRRRWYIACCTAPNGQQYRFHMPPFGSGALIPQEIAATAIEVAPHDPTQPMREIPESELGLMDQLLLIETFAATVVQP